ncbi:MAG TPA: TorF family putative porin [Methylophilus sp.]
MRKSVLLTAVLASLSVANLAYAEEAAVEAAPAAAEPASAWTATSNIGFVSDYYTRGVSQSWHKPAVQGGFDIAHSSGFFAGVWGSNVTPNTFPDATVELDLYGGYAGTIPAVEGLGYSVGVIGYFYPGGSWKKYGFLTDTQGTKGVGVKKGGRWDTYEANFGLSYKWLSAKASITLGDWFGAEKETGWDGSTSGSTYVELNAAYPLPIAGLTLIAHVGRLNVSGKLSQDPAFAGSNTNAFGIVEDSPDYTDYKIGLSKSFTIGKAEGWNAGVYYVGATNGGNSGYWGSRGYGGSSFNGSSETKDLTDDRVVVTVGRTF